jgi:hypothetical protein
VPLVTCYNINCIYNSDYNSDEITPTSFRLCTAVHITVTGPSNECSSCDESEIGGGKVW